MTGSRRDGDGNGEPRDGLRARLHEAAGAHRPDRARMLARVERGMAAGDRSPARPPLAGWARVTGATVAVAAVLVADGYTVASAVRDDTGVRHSVAASPGAREPESRRSESRRPESWQAGPLSSQGAVDPHSNEFWAQSNLTLRTRAPLTALTVELRVAQTGSVTSTGAWRSLPEDDFAFAVAERDGFLVYRWTLRRGRTVPAGEWIFAGQYNHVRGGRDARGDRYTATATAASGRLSVEGGFTRGG
ncbi:hypothetical protein [Streptomyces sp. NBC_00334]|uniref:hypothetical protein n=1 Tax=Streptomyces sp. NBC_00334 TaxID=2975713 RepID=UPI002E28222C|nr:hypothetical protein [Streptomyces sp. NBC_00334]